MIVILVLVPLLVSATLLLVYWLTNDLPARTLTVLTICFLVAAWLQFFSWSAPWPTVGLVLQALLAIVLSFRMKMR
jgi:hypothetical protein